MSPEGQGELEDPRVSVCTGIPGCRSWARGSSGHSASRQSCADTLKMGSASTKPGMTVGRNVPVWHVGPTHLEFGDRQCKFLKDGTFLTIPVKICTSSLLGLIKNRHWLANGWDNKQTFDVSRWLEDTRTKEFK